MQVCHTNCKCSCYVIRLYKAEIAFSVIVQLLKSTKKYITQIGTQLSIHAVQGPILPLTLKPAETLYCRVPMAAISCKKCSSTILKKVNRCQQRPFIGDQLLINSVRGSLGLQVMFSNTTLTECHRSGVYVYKLNNTLPLN